MKIFWKNITDDEICETFNIDKEVIVLDRVKKLPDDIIKKIFQYFKSPFNIEIKNEIEKRTKKNQPNCGRMTDGWREFSIRNPTSVKFLFDCCYYNRFYGVKAWSSGGANDGLCVVHSLSLAHIRKIGYENGVKGRSKKEIVYKLMKL